jgi:hypothetical protein
MIGFVGVGYMGHGMAANILAAGYPLLVKGNRNRAPVDDLVGRGAREAGSVAEMAAACDILHLCLSNSPQVEAIVRGPDGILAGAREGLIVIDTTTADPASTMALADELAKKGVTLVDAPLGRTPKEAEAGTLDAIVGASDTVMARIRPVIEAWAGNINHVGPTGSAHRMKLLMNFVALGYAALYSEALVLGAKSGIAPQTFARVIGGSRLSNGFFDTFMQYAVGRDREAHLFTITNGSKDVRYGQAMAAEARVAGLMGAAMQAYFTSAEAQGKGGDYVPMLADHVAALNGIDLGAEVAKGARDAE